MAEIDERALNSALEAMANEAPAPGWNNMARRLVELYEAARSRTIEAGRGRCVRCGTEVLGFTCSDCLGTQRVTIRDLKVEVAEPADMSAPEIPSPEHKPGD